LYLVILELAQKSITVGRPTTQNGQDTGTPSGTESEDTLASMAALKQELRVKEEYLQTTNEELETSNEEMQSMNEELQSTNEELETSKEELQSLNEELSTINAELQTKVADLQRANNDMNNLLAGTGIATVFVDQRLHIMRFTSTATKIINLIHSDIGRPVSHIVSNLPGYDNLAEDTREVLETLIPRELDVRTAEGRWYSMRIQPYRTVDNVIEGAVLTFVDITDARRLQEVLRVNEERLRVALSAASISVFNQDTDLRYTWIHNPIPGFVSKLIIGKTDTDLLPEKEAAELTAIKQRVLETGRGMRQNAQITAAGKTSVYDLTVEPLYDASGTIAGITCALLDVTGQRSPEVKGSPGEGPLPGKTSRGKP
jgi:two-component system CheB/CheR fusion protein